MQDIFTELQDLEKSYRNSSIEIVEGLKFSQDKTIKMVEYYSNSKYLTSNDRYKDDRPFYNIVNANVDISTVATDVDTKDITIKADDPEHYDKSFLLNKDVHKWMEDVNFAKKLNDMTATRARYGGVLVKKVEKDGDLDLQIVDWKNSITDPIDIKDGMKVEIHYMTPAQLNRKSDVWDNIDEAIKLAREETEQSPRNQCTVYEIHGEFPASVDPDDEDTDPSEFKRMVFYIAGANDQKQHILFKDEEKEDPYKYLPWKERAGRSLGIGVVEEGEEAQVWTNDAVQREKEAMELGSKTVFWTDSKVIGNQSVNEIDNGFIFQGEQGEQFAQVNTLSNALPEFQNLIEKWGNQYDRTSSVTEAARGETPPSGTAFRLQALVQQQADSVFDYRREEMGIFLNEIFNDWVIPHLEKKINKEHVLNADLDFEEMQQIDENYRTHKANELIVEKVAEGSVVSPIQYQQLVQNQELLLQSTGNTRFFKVPKDYYKDLKSKVTINITGEQRNKQAILESLSAILNSYNPQAMQDPFMRDIFRQIVEIAGAGVSPMALNRMQKQQLESATQQLQELTQLGNAASQEEATGASQRQGNVPSAVGASAGGSA